MPANLVLPEQMDLPHPDAPGWDVIDPQRGLTSDKLWSQMADVDTNSYKVSYRTWKPLVDMIGRAADNEDEMPSRIFAFLRAWAEKYRGTWSPHTPRSPSPHTPRSPSPHTPRSPSMTPPAPLPRPHELTPPTDMPPASDSGWKALFVFYAEPPQDGASVLAALTAANEPHESEDVLKKRWSSVLTFILRTPLDDDVDARRIAIHDRISACLTKLKASVPRSPSPTMSALSSVNEEYVAAADVAAEEDDAESAELDTASASTSKKRKACECPIGS
jgi:hypothetical protein